MRNIYLLFTVLAAVQQSTSCDLSQYYVNPAVAPVQTQEKQAATRAVEQKTPAADDPCPTLRNNPPLGLACLHCMQPEAWDQVRVLTNILYNSCQQNLALNYLTDGTFSFNADLLKSQIDYLSRNGRKLFLHFYLIDGPSQRWDNTPHRGFAADMEPEEFRELIQYDANFQDSYQGLVQRLLPVLAHAKQKGAVLSIAPVLEDNLTDEAFVAIANLTREALPSDLNVYLSRNPCRNCYEGNEDGVPEGLFLEQHTASPGAVRSRGLVTNDGIEYGGAEKSGGAMPTTSIENLARVRDAAAAKSSIFILWSAERQGYTIPRKAAAQRNYAIPDEAETQLLLRFLRGEG